MSTNVPIYICYDSLVIIIRGTKKSAMIKKTQNVMALVCKVNWGGKSRWVPLRVSLQVKGEKPVWDSTEHLNNTVNKSNFKGEHCPAPTEI